MSDDGCDEGMAGIKSRLQEASIDSTQLDAILHLLSDQPCRSAVYSFQEARTDVLDYDEVVDYVIDRAPEAEDPERTKILLHHKTLPRMKDEGLIDYDSRSETIRYDGAEEVRTVVACLNEIEAESP